MEACRSTAMACRAVVTISASSEIISDAVDVSASTQRCLPAVVMDEVLSKGRRASLSRRLVSQNGHPGRNHGGVDEFEVHSPGGVLEDGPPRPEQDRGNQDAVLVDEVVFQQAVREVLTAVYDQVLAGLLLERADPVRDVAFDQAGVLPLQVPERG